MTQQPDEPIAPELPKRVAPILTILIVLALFVFLIPNIFINIRAGQAGVLWKRFDGGTQTAGPRNRPFAGRLRADRTGEPTELIERGNPYPYSEGLRII